MSVGIYMPTYNVEKYINESIYSIITQTYDDWELVILDDYSDDKTFEIAKTFLSDKISVYRKTNHSGKIGSLKNEAISLLKKTHTYIGHVGSDDRISKDCLQIFVEFMEKNPDIGVACGNFLCFNEKGMWALPHVANSGDFDPKVLLSYMNVFPMRFYRKEMVDKVGGYDENLTSAVDYDLNLKLSEITIIKRIKTKITYYYRQHEEQVSTKSRSEQDKNAKTALENALKRRGINGSVIGDRPPFQIKLNEEEDFIWGKNEI